MMKEPFTVTVNGASFIFDLAALMLDENSIDEHLCSQAKDSYNSERLYQSAKSERTALEQDLKTTAAQLYGTLRASADGKVTEAMISNQVLAHPTYKAVADKLQNALRTESQLLALVNAYSQRKECLLELARNYRANLAKLGGNSI